MKKTKPAAGAESFEKNKSPPRRRKRKKQSPPQAPKILKKQSPPQAPKNLEKKRARRRRRQILKKQAPRLVASSLLAGPKSAQGWLRAPYSPGPNPPKAGCELPTRRAQIRRQNDLSACLLVGIKLFCPGKKHAPAHKFCIRIWAGNPISPPVTSFLFDP